MVQTRAMRRTREKGSKLETENDRKKETGDEEDLIEDHTPNMKQRSSKSRTEPRTQQRQRKKDTLRSQKLAKKVNRRNEEADAKNSVGSKEGYAVAETNRLSKRDNLEATWHSTKLMVAMVACLGLCLSLLLSANTTIIAMTTKHFFPSSSIKWQNTLVLDHFQSKGIQAGQPSEVEHFLETLEAFAEDILYWIDGDTSVGERSQGLEPNKHPVTLRVSSNNASLIRYLVEETLAVGFELSEGQRAKAILSLQASEMTWKEAKHAIDSFLTDKTGRDGLPSIVIINRIESFPEVLELKNYLDAEIIRVNVSDYSMDCCFRLLLLFRFVQFEKEVDFKGLGFILMSFNLPPERKACQEIDTLGFDKTKLRWTNNFLGRITYRTRLCV